MKKNIIVLLFFMLWQAHITHASQRLALIIGNGDYSIADGKLPNPTRDARAIARQLELLGFEVSLKTDLTDKEAMEKAVDEFSEQLSNKDIGLFYYAGHALQLGDVNYLMPTEAQIKKASEVKYRALNSNYLLDKMANYKPRLSVVILDACRDNPFPKESRSGATRGLGRMQAPSDMLIAFATKPGTTAKDGDGLHSPYTEMLLRFLKQASHIPIQVLFNKVGVAVEAKTHYKQSPRLEMSPLHSRFCFSECRQQDTSPILIRTDSAHDLGIDPISVLMIISSLLLLAAFLVYRLYYRQQAINETTQNTAVAQVKQPDTLPKKRLIQPDLSTCHSQAFAYLCDANSNTAVGEIEQGKPVTLGRSSQSTIILSHRAISAHHAEISWHPGSETFLLQDKGTTNGTWIEQQAPLQKQVKTEIKRGEVFYLGHKGQAYYIY